MPANLLQRIKAILEFKALTASGFADTIGIARPVMSHILSGRNNPSLEVVQKILKAFPELSIPWLVMGEGGMLKSVDKAPLIVPDPEPKNQPADQAASKITPELKPEIIQKPKSSVEKPSGSLAVGSVTQKVLVLYPDKTFEEFERRE